MWLAAKPSSTRSVVPAMPVRKKSQTLDVLATSDGLEQVLGVLVTKTASSSDARGNVARLTPRDMVKLESAWPVHLVSVRHRFLACIFAAAVEGVARAWPRWPSTLRPRLPNPVCGVSASRSGPGQRGEADRRNGLDPFEQPRSEHNVHHFGHRPCPSPVALQLAGQRYPADGLSPRPDDAL
jgi:hypothetical protein